MSENPVFIFDFDGTIADSPLRMVQIFNRIAKDFGLNPIKDEDHEKLKNLGSLETLKFLDIPIYKYPFLSKRMRTEFKKEISNLKPISGMLETLKKLHERGESFGIITSNSEENVRFFLKKNNIDFFKFVVGGSTMFGKHKVLKKVIKENKFLPGDVIYVGDEGRDVKAARKAGIKIVAVSWGINSKELLAANNPDWLIENPREFLLINFKVA